MKISLGVLTVFALSVTSIDSMARPSPSASASTKVDIPPWPDRDGLPRFDAEAFSDEKSPPPKPDEWKSATAVRLTRVSDAVPTSCVAYRLREWMKVHCDTKTAGLRLLAGSPTGIALWVADSLVSEKEYQEKGDASNRHFETMGRFAEVIFPVRPGDRRVFEWLRLDILEAYEGPPGVGSTSSMLLEEQWPEGGKPEIALLKR